MEKRRLGRTGHESSVLIFGGAALWEESQAAAEEAIDMVRAAGVNHFDVAPQYGKAESLLGPWLADHREEVFLGCKTLKRNRDDAWRDLQTSLEALQVDDLDLYQLHAITNRQELNAALSDGGAIEALQEAREKGIVKWLGITGHGYDTAQVQVEALERFDFDTVMTPLNFIQWADPAWRVSFRRLADLCAEKDVGMVIIKAAAKGPWGDREQTYNTWYEPFDTQEMIDRAVRFVLSHPQVTGFTHPGDLRLLPLALTAAENFAPLGGDEREALVQTASQYDPLFVQGDFQPTE